MKSNILFWKISLTFFLILTLVGIGYVFISVNSARQYFLESNQKLYGDIAVHTVKEVKPLVNGAVDTLAIQDIMHSMMVINPSVEVYLLDTKGKIITYVAPYKTVELEHVDLRPIQTFLDRKEDELVLGDDPRHPGRSNIFSAARIEQGEILQGYVYVILSSDLQSGVSDTLFSSYILKLGTRAFLITLLLALCIGLFAVWLITKNLRSIIDAFRRFRDGQHSIRIQSGKDTDLNLLANTFNDMADTLQSNIEELQSVEGLRRELIANVSHDLRTPLSIMKGYVETLQLKGENLPKEKRNQYLDIIYDSANKLSSLVSQLFELSKLEANEIIPEKEPFSISDLAMDIAMKYKLVAEEKGISLDLDVPESTTLVFADISLVERVIQNLMDNAMKFSASKGKVLLSIKEKKKHVEIQISDDGPGISQKEQTYIFERYKQAKDSTTKTKSEGMGLGLAIAQKIMELHNSKITVQSEMDRGASFAFQLPAFNQ